MSRTLGTLFLSLVMAAGCGDDDDDTVGDGDADADADADSDADGDGDGDGDADGDGDGDADGDADFNEGEPNDFDAPRDITLPATITGRVADPQPGPQGQEGDFDVFRFAATAGTVVRITLSGLDRLTPYLGLRCDEGTLPPIYRELTATTPGLTRQAFLPVDGDYVVFLSDEANFGNGRPVGGAGYEYTLEIVTETVTPEDVTLPLDVENDATPADNGVRIYRMTADAAGLLVADIDAIDDHDPVSDLDSAIVLMDDDLTGLLAENDDENLGAGRYDSFLRQSVAAGDVVHLVVDFYWTGPESSHHVGVTLADLGIEVEPNDDTGTAWPLAVTAPEEAPAPVTATIGAPGQDADGNDVPDWDYFALGDLDEGDAVEVTVTPTAESLLVPRVFVGTLVDFGFGPQLSIDWESQAGADGVARIEATAVSTGPAYALVADARNVVSVDALPDLQAVGGDEYGYSIAAVQWPRVVTDVTLPVDDPSLALGRTGEVDWYGWSLPGDGNVLVVRATTAGWDATLSLFDHTPWVPEGGNEIDPIVGSYLAYEEGVAVLPYVGAAADLALAVWNAGPWPGATADYALSLESLAPDASTAEALDFGDDEGTAEVVAVAIADYTGQLTQDDESVDVDVFAVDLLEGQRIVVATYPTDPDALTDTTLSLDGGSLDTPLENDDWSGYYSQVTYLVPAGGAGRHTITLASYCAQGECSVGPYGLRVIVLD